MNPLIWAGIALFLLLLLTGNFPAADFVGYTTITITNSCTGETMGVYAYGCRTPTCSSSVGGNYKISPFSYQISNLNEYYLFCDKPKGSSGAACATWRHDGQAPLSWSGVITPSDGCVTPETYCWKLKASTECVYTSVYDDGNCRYPEYYSWLFRTQEECEANIFDPSRVIDPGPRITIFNIIEGFFTSIINFFRGLFGI